LAFGSKPSPNEKTKPKTILDKNRAAIYTKAKYNSFFKLTPNRKTIENITYNSAKNSRKYL
jgi:hypothetical protein